MIVLHHKQYLGRKMAQHFLLSPKAKQFSTMQIARLSEKEAETWFRNIRWEDTNGEPVCPECGCTEHWWLPSTQRWKCKGCKKQFSVTSGTLLHGHKKPLKDYLYAIARFSNTAKSLAALQLSREMCIHYRTAWLWLQKIRSALFDTRFEGQMNGIVEIDACYTNYYVKPANRIEDRVDRRLKQYQSLNKRCIYSLRMRDPIDKGACYTITYVDKSENPKAVATMAERHIVPGVEVHVDENKAFESLDAYYSVKRVNHQECYSGENGENNNQCESFNSRFKRMKYGILHRFGLKYLDLYANEIAYREDTRRWSNLNIFRDISEKSIQSPVNNEFVNYCRGNGRIKERLI